MSGYPGSSHSHPSAELSADAPAELAGDAPQSTQQRQHHHQHPLQSHPVGVGIGAGILSPPPPPPHPSSGRVSPATPTFFPPPPPGPPPSHGDNNYVYGQQQQQQQQQHEQQYYPPPPPGPPPHQDLTQDWKEYYERNESHGANEPPPPSYAEEFGQGGVPYADGDVKIAVSPPPPSAQPQQQGLSASAGLPPALPPRPSSASGGAGMVFAPPPMSPSQEPGVSSGAAGHASGSGGSGGSGGGGFGEKLYRWGTKAGVPVNRLVNKLGSEAFWPMTMDKECDKAARILRGFCQTGFYTTTTNTGNNNSSSNVNNPAHQRASSPSPPTKTSTTNTPSHSKVLAKIPKSVLASAKGLAIFTTFRTGLHLSGAGGSGVVVARLADGVSWSPPAGFLVHTLGAGLMVGIDVYDCVCVLTTQAAVDAFARRARLSLGGEIAVVAGPVGVGGAVEGFLPGKKGGAANPGGNANANVANTAGGGVAGGDGGVAGVGNEKDKDKNKTGNGPVWSYMKSRGFYAGVQADGTVIIPREEANAAFYGEHGISVERILKGQVKTTQQTPAAAAIGKEKAKDADLVMWPEGGRQLMETLKAVEGKRADEDVLRKLGDGPTPGDLAPPPDGGKV